MSGSHRQAKDSHATPRFEPIPKRTALARMRKRLRLRGSLPANSSSKRRSAIVSGDCRLRSERGRTSNDRAGSLRRVGMLCGQRRTGQAIEKSAACDCTCVMVLSFPQRLGSADAKMIAPSLQA